MWRVFEHKHMWGPERRGHDDSECGRRVNLNNCRGFQSHSGDSVTQCVQSGETTLSHHLNCLTSGAVIKWSALSADETSDYFQGVETPVGSVWKKKCSTMRTACLHQVVWWTECSSVTLQHKPLPGPNSLSKFNQAALKFQTLIDIRSLVCFLSRSVNYSLGKLRTCWKTPRLLPPGCLCVILLTIKHSNQQTNRQWVERS